MESGGATLLVETWQREKKKNYVNEKDIFVLDFYGFLCYPGVVEGHRSSCVG